MLAACMCSLCMTECVTFFRCFHIFHNMSCNFSAWPRRGASVWGEDILEMCRQDISNFFQFIKLKLMVKQTYLNFTCNAVILLLILKYKTIFESFFFAQKKTYYRTNAISISCVLFCFVLFVIWKNCPNGGSDQTTAWLRSKSRAMTSRSVLSETAVVIIRSCSPDTQTRPPQSL